MGDIALAGAALSNVLSSQRPSEFFASTSNSIDSQSTAGRSDPVDFFSPNSLNSRAFDLSRLQDTKSDTVQVLQKAKQGISILETIVDYAETLARDAMALQTETAQATSSVTGLTGRETLESAFGLLADDTITIGDGVQEITLTADGQNTVDTLISAVNSDLNLDVKASLYINSLKLEATQENSITVSVADNSGSGATVSNTGFTDLGSNIIANAGSISLNRLGIANNYNDTLALIDEISKAADYNGVNLLNGSDLVEKFNVNNIPTISVDGVKFTSDNLNLTNAKNKFQTNVDTRSAINVLDQASVKLSNQSAIFNAKLAAIEINEGFASGLIGALESSSQLKVQQADQRVATQLAQQTRQLVTPTDTSLTSGSSYKDTIKNI